MRHPKILKKITLTKHHTIKGVGGKRARGILSTLKLALRRNSESVTQMQQLSPDRDGPGHTRELTRKFAIDPSEIGRQSFNKVVATDVMQSNASEK